LLSWLATLTPHMYMLSLHDALPIYFAFNLLEHCQTEFRLCINGNGPEILQVILGIDLEFNAILKVHQINLYIFRTIRMALNSRRSEEHTSELQSRFDLVCRLLLETK